MIQFSANLGLLWTDRPLPDAIRAAHLAGFDAVECHWPYDVPAQDIVKALNDTGLPMLGLNTRRGNVAVGEFGLCALPGRQTEARDAISEALDYAQEVGAGAIHALAGVAQGPEAHQVYCEALEWACTRAGPSGISILIEAVNAYDVPGYFLRDTHQACAIIEDIAAPNLKLMFDCYHVARTEGDVIPRLRDVWPVLGHIQFAGVPDRGPPDTGTVDYASLFAEVESRGWTRPLAAEYNPRGPTEKTLDWMNVLRS